MMINTINNIKNIFKEAQNKNYPEHILNYDLNNCLKTFVKDISSHYEEELEWAETNGYDDAYEEGKEEGYEDGYNEGVGEANYTFVKTLASHIINLKQKIRDNPNLTHKEIQLLITELLVNMDEDEIIPYTEKDDVINAIDNEIA